MRNILLAVLITFFSIILFFSCKTDYNVSLSSNDDLAPIVSIESPYNEFYTNISEITLSGKVWDNLSINYVGISVSGNEYSQMTVDKQLWNYNATLTEGANLVTVKALDRSANVTESSIIINLDTVKPEPPTSSPAEGYYIDNQSVTLSAEAGAKIYFTTDGSEPTIYSDIFSTTSTLNENKINIKKTSVIKTIAVDKAGNISDIASYTFEIDPMLNHDFTSALPIAEDTITPGAIKTETENDYYLIDVPENVAGIVIRLTGITENLDLYLYDSSQSLLLSVSSDQLEETIIYQPGGTALTPGIYYVIVNGKAGAISDYILNYYLCYMDLGFVTWLNVSQGEYTDKIRIEWDYVKDATKYKLFRADNNAQPLFYHPIADLTGTIYDDTLVVANNTYYYSVQTGNDEHYGPFSAGVSGFMASSGSGEGDQYEEDDTASAAKPIVVNTPQLHTIDPAGDLDWYSFSAANGSTYQIETYNLLGGCDTILYLYSTDGASEITFDNDGGVAAGSKITWDCSASGTYYFLVKDFSPLRGGNSVQYYIKLTNLNASLPEIPTSVTATDGIFDTKINVTWQEVPGADLYEISRSTASSGTYTALNTTANITFDDTTLSLPADLGKNFYYKVRAHNSVGWGDWSNFDNGYADSGDGCEGAGSDDVYTGACLITVDGPSQLHAIDPAGDIDWVKFAATSGTTYIIDTYNLQNNCDTFIYLYSTDGSTEIDNDDDSGDGGYASQIIWTCSLNGTYYIKVLDFNPDRSSDFKGGPNITYNIKVTTAGGAPPSPPSWINASDDLYSDYVKISCNASTGADKYAFYRCATQNGTYENISNTVTTTSYNDTTVEQGVIYYYKAKAGNANGWSNFSTYDDGKRALAIPAPPINVSASDGTYTDRIRISWSASSGATKYQIYRSTSASSGYTLIRDNETNIYYDDTSPVSGTTYYYKVKAGNAAGWSSYSDYNSGIKQAEVVKVKWTIMVYLDADNNLEAAGVEDINEMEGINLTGEDINVIVLMDRIPGYSTAAGDWTGTRLYKVEYDSAGVNNLTIVSTRLSSSVLGVYSTGTQELNMGDPGNVSKFVDFCKSNYPADKYGIIFWNHGSGWKKDNDDETPAMYKEVCTDDTNNHDALYMNEIQSALSGRNIDFIGFDACVMGMIEVAYEMKTVASVMTASEELEPGDGWEYNIFLSSFKNKSMRTARDLGESIVDAFQERYATTSKTTLAALDLSKIDALRVKLDTFQSSLRAYSKSSIRSIAFNSTQSYLYYKSSSYSTDKYEYTYMDIYHFANNCGTVAGANDVKSAVTDFVIKEYHHYTSSNSHGISIFFRTIKSGYSDGYESSERDFATNSQWNEFLTWVSSDL